MATRAPTKLMTRQLWSIGVWILPTRHRQERCQETLNAISKLGPSSGTVFMDGCIYDNAFALPKGWAAFGSYEHRELGGVLRWAFETFPDEDTYGFISDDMIPQAPNWADALELSAGRWRIASSNDLWKGGSRMAGALCFGGDLLRSLGYWVPDGMCHLYIDDVWEAVGSDLDCWIYRQDVVVEHHHPGAGKAKRDETYARVIDGKPYSESDQRLYREWSEAWPEEAERVKRERDNVSMLRAVGT